MTASWDPVWETVFTTQAWGKYPGEDLIRFVARNFYKAPNRINVELLEVGFGTGANLWFIAREGFTVHGVEGSSSALNMAIERLNREVPDWKGDLCQDDMLNLDYPDNRFDAVIDNEAIYANSFEHAQTMYKEAHRVLKPGGLMFSRMFTDETTGYGTGQQVGLHAFMVDTGPMAGKGYTRFTTRECLTTLFSPFTLVELQLISRENDHGEKVSEWIAIGQKNMVE